MFVVFWVVPCGACASDRVSGERSDHNIVGSEAVRLQWSHPEGSKLLPDSSEHMIISVLCCLAAVSKIPCRHAAAMMREPKKPFLADSPSWSAIACAEPAAPCLASLSILPDHRLQQEPLPTSPPTYLPVAWRLQPCMQPCNHTCRDEPYLGRGTQTHAAWLPAGSPPAGILQPDLPTPSSTPAVAPTPPLVRFSPVRFSLVVDVKVQSPVRLSLVRLSLLDFWLLLFAAYFDAATKDMAMETTTQRSRMCVCEVCVRMCPPKTDSQATFNWLNGFIVALSLIITHLLIPLFYHPTSGRLQQPSCPPPSRRAVLLLTFAFLITGADAAPQHLSAADLTSAVGELVSACGLVRVMLALVRSQGYDAVKAALARREPGASARGHTRSLPVEIYRRVG